MGDDHCQPTNASLAAQSDAAGAEPVAGDTDCEMAIMEACNEAGCAYDNEALLKAIADLKASAHPHAVPQSVLEALEPFVNFANVPAFEHFSDDFVLTMGSRMAMRQLTAGDFRKLLTALSASPGAQAGEDFDTKISEAKAALTEFKRWCRTDISKKSWDALHALEDALASKGKKND